MPTLTRNCELVFDMKIWAAPNNATNFAGDPTIRINVLFPNVSPVRAVYRFRRPSKLRAGQTISSAPLILNYSVGAGSNPRDILIAPILQPGMTVDATWDRYDGVTAWDSAGGDYVTSVESIHIEGANLAAGAKTYDIANVIERAIALDPNGEYIDLLIKMNSEALVESFTLNAYEDADGVRDAEAPTLAVVFDPDASLHTVGLEGGGARLAFNGQSLAP